MIAALMMLASNAHALSCDENLNIALPADGAVDVPTDVQIRLTAHWGTLEHQTPLLRDSTGADIAVQIEQAGNPGSQDMVILTPEQPLSPESTYTISAAYSDTDEWEMGSFTTGAGEGAAPPTPEVLSVIRDRGKDEWGAWDWIDISLVEPDAPVTYIARVSAGGDDGFQDVAIQGYPDGNQTALALVGSGVCGGPIDLEGGDHQIQIAAVSYNGEMSEFTDTQDAAAGCSSANSAPSALAALLAGLAFAPLRRRSRAG